jgi:hypothetical protein
MTYGTKQFKNGKVRGYLTFSSGKRIVLKPRENAEFETRLRFVEETGRMKEREGNK